MRRQHGFTLIELLIVVVIIGILASVAIPKFRNTKGKAYASSMKSDLRNLASAQEAYMYERSTYATDLADLNFARSNGVELAIVQGTSSGWSATAWHAAASPIECGMFIGAATPAGGATQEGQIGCTNLP